MTHRVFIVDSKSEFLVQYIQNSMSVGPPKMRGRRRTRRRESYFWEDFLFRFWSQKWNRVI